MKTDQYKQIARAIIMVCGIDAARDLDYDLSCFGARSNLHGATKAGLHNALREGIYEYGAQNKKAKTPRPITQQHLSNELRKLASNAAHCERVRWVECGECGHINHGHAASEAGYEYDGITQCQACGEVKIRQPKGDIPPVVKGAA